ncbi:hypothetical protein [Actinophytocola glycyrrhizae]|uniref:PE family protein n=1 Tax=Actinophytocola glycyrrhizae TaxID=2044873 RepID=A0ABV9SB81_9PSEU
MGELHKGEGLRTIANAAQAQGTFSFDPDDLRSLIKKWQELADSYENSIYRADSMTRIDPPGGDFASESYVKVAIASGNSYIEYLRHNQQYCSRQAQLFQDALDDYLGVEQTNVTEVNESGREV